MSINFGTLQGLTIPEGVVTQISDAAGRVLWMATIKFTINGDIYVADRGMTWSAWFASDYNTTGETEGTITDANGNEVSMDAVIVGGTAYEVGFSKLELIHDFGTITTKQYFTSALCNIDNFVLPSNIVDCNIIMVNGVIYEAVCTQYEEGTNAGNILINLSGAISTLVNESYPYSIFYTARLGRLTIYTHPSTGGTYEISIWKQ